MSRKKGFRFNPPRRTEGGANSGHSQWAFFIILPYENTIQQIPLHRFYPSWFLPSTNEQRLHASCSILWNRTRI